MDEITNQDTIIAVFDEYFDMATYDRDLTIVIQGNPMPGIKSAEDVHTAMRLLGIPKKAVHETFESELSRIIYNNNNTIIAIHKKYQNKLLDELHEWISHYEQKDWRIHTNNLLGKINSMRAK